MLLIWSTLCLAFTFVQCSSATPAPIPPASPDTIGVSSSLAISTDDTNINSIANLLNSSTLTSKGQPNDPLDVRQMGEWSKFSRYREPNLTSVEINDFGAEMEGFLVKMMQDQGLEPDDEIPMKPMEFTSPTNGLHIYMWGFSKVAPLTFDAGLSIATDMPLYAKLWRSPNKPKSCDVEFKEKINGQWVQTGSGALTKSTPTEALSASNTTTVTVSNIPRVSEGLPTTS